MTYNRFFFESNSNSGTAKRIKLLDPSKVGEFFQVLAQDQEIDNNLALVCLLGFSGGCRITEILKIKRSDVRFDGEFYFIEINVLKKKTDNVKRTIVLHASGNARLAQVLNKKRYNEFLFKERGEKATSRFNFHYALKKYFGISPHYLRHSAVSYHLFKSRSDLQIASTFRMSVNNVRNYIHSNTAQVLKDMMINL